MFDHIRIRLFARKTNGNAHLLTLNYEYNHSVTIHTNLLHNILRKKFAARKTIIIY